MNRKDKLYRFALQIAATLVFEQIIDIPAVPGISLSDGIGATVLIIADELDRLLPILIDQIELAPWKTFPTPAQANSSTKQADQVQDEKTRAPALEDLSPVEDIPEADLTTDDVEKFSTGYVVKCPYCGFAVKAPVFNNARHAVESHIKSTHQRLPGDNQ